MTQWADQDILLDPAIRNWVLLPITVVMLLVGILRHYATLLLHTPPKPLPPAALREQRALLRSAMLRANGCYLPPVRFEERRRLLGAALVEGHFLKNGPKDSEDEESKGQQAPPNPLDAANMEGMMDGMKKQMVMMIPQTIIMGWINQFFFGFLCVKLPFPLPNKFKTMLQRGIDAPNLDVTWVSSLSWYFLNLFGLGALYSLILGEGNAAGETAMNMGGMGMANPAMSGVPGQQVDYVKLFAAENDGLLMLEHKWVCDGNGGVEERVLRLHGR